MRDDYCSDSQFLFEEPTLILDGIEMCMPIAVRVTMDDAGRMARVEVRPFGDDWQDLPEHEDDTRRRQRTLWRAIDEHTKRMPDLREDRERCADAEARFMNTYEYGDDAPYEAPLVL